MRLGYLCIGERRLDVFVALGILFQRNRGYTFPDIIITFQISIWNILNKSLFELTT